MSERFEFPRATAAETGISPCAIKDMLLDWAQKELETHSFMLLRNGCVASEGCWAWNKDGRLAVKFILTKYAYTEKVELEFENEKAFAHVSMNLQVEPAFTIEGIRA